MVIWLANKRVVWLQPPQEQWENLYRVVAGNLPPVHDVVTECSEAVERLLSADVILTTYSVRLQGFNSAIVLQWSMSSVMMASRVVTALMFSSHLSGHLS